MIKKIEIERFSLTTSKSFDEVVACVNAAIGHPDIAEFAGSTHEARPFAELKSAVERGLSKAGLMSFNLVGTPKSAELIASLQFDAALTGEITLNQNVEIVIQNESVPGHVIQIAKAGRPAFSPVKSPGGIIPTCFAH
jgi:hypothetical protein